MLLSLMNQPFWGTPIYGNLRLLNCLSTMMPSPGTSVEDAIVESPEELLGGFGE